MYIYIYILCVNYIIYCLVGWETRTMLEGLEVGESGRRGNPWYGIFFEGFVFI